MILVGNQRGGGKDLATHLMKEENERVTVHEVRGFVVSDLHGAFQESYAISRATQCKQHLYSLSLNPPKDEKVSVAEFEDAIARAEDRLGLTGQPRAIVFHEKIGADGELRRHAHAVWCRIDTDEMKAIHKTARQAAGARRAAGLHRAGSPRRLCLRAFRDTSRSEALSRKPARLPQNPPRTCHQ